MYKVLEHDLEGQRESWFEVGMAPTYRLAMNILTNIVVRSLGFRSFKIMDPDGKSLLFVASPMRETS